MNKLEGEKSWINLKNYNVYTLYGFEMYLFYCCFLTTILEFIAINHQQKEKEKETLYKCLFFS